jgi:hypothetical protein
MPVFDTDENGNDYVTLSHETKQMNWQGGIDSSENLKEKRTKNKTRMQSGLPSPNKYVEIFVNSFNRFRPKIGKSLCRGCHRNLLTTGANI